MYRLYTTHSIINQGTIIPKDWNHLKSYLNNNLTKTIKFYRNSTIPVSSDHLLVKLIQSFNIPLSLNINRYFDYIDDRSLNLSMSLGMTSAIYPGKMFRNVFFGENSNEIIIAQNNEFDINSLKNNWKKLRSISILKHPYTNLNLDLPNGKNKYSETGISVISINIPLLMLQYREFVLSEENKQHPRTVMHFLHMYAIPNMLPSLLDGALINRFNCLLTSTPIITSLNKHSFFLTDCNKDLNRIYFSLIDNLLKNSDNDIYGILRNIPLVFYNNALEYAYLPKIVPTRQINWALSLSRLDLTIMILRMLIKTKSARSKSEINLLLRMLDQYRTNNIFPTVLTNDVVREEVNSKILLVSKLAKKVT